MNYTQLELGGEARGFKFGIGFLRTVTESKKITLDELFKQFSSAGMDSVFLITELMYYSLICNLKSKKEEINITLEDVEDWIDKDGGFNSPVYGKFSEALSASLTVDLGKETPQKEVATKK